MCVFTSGLWSSPVTTGSTPPPCLSFSFFKGNNNTAVLFGGVSEWRGASNQLYTLDLNDMVRHIIPGIAYSISHNISHLIFLLYTTHAY